MTTDEMLEEIVNYEYESYGFPIVWMDYNSTFKVWGIFWRNPKHFSNEDERLGKSPNEACKKALDFIKSNPQYFTKK